MNCGILHYLEKWTLQYYSSSLSHAKAEPPASYMRTYIDGFFYSFNGFSSAIILYYVFRSVFWTNESFQPIKVRIASIMSIILLESYLSKYKQHPIEKVRPSFIKLRIVSFEFLISLRILIFSFMLYDGNPTIWDPFAPQILDGQLN